LASPGASACAFRRLVHFSLFPSIKIRSQKVLAKKKTRAGFLPALESSLLSHCVSPLSITRFSWNVPTKPTELHNGVPCHASRGGRRPAGRLQRALLARVSGAYPGALSSSSSSTKVGTPQVFTCLRLLVTRACSGGRDDDGGRGEGFPVAARGGCQEHGAPTQAAAGERDRGGAVQVELS
jgi:hypothetical protein